MVYGEPKRIPIKETDMPQPINPYAKTKYMIEEILKDNVCDYFSIYIYFYILNFTSMLLIHKSGV